MFLIIKESIAVTITKLTIELKIILLLLPNILRVVSPHHHHQTPADEMNRVR